MVRPARPALNAAGSRTRSRLRAGLPMLARAAAMAASLALTVVVARQLDPVAAGAFFVANALVQTAATAGRFGTDNLALKIAAGDPVAAGNHVPGLIRLALLTSTAAGLLLAVVLAVLPWHGQVPISQVSVVLLGVAVPAAAASVLSGAVLRGLGHLISGIGYELGVAPAVCCAILLTRHAAGHPATLGGTIVVFAASQLLTALMALWACRARLSAVLTGSAEPGRPVDVRQADRPVDVSEPGRPVGRSSGPTPSVPLGVRQVYHEHVRALASMMLTSLLFYLLTWAPVIVLGLVGDPEQAAYYNLAARVSAFITIVPALQVALLTPAFAAHHRHRRIGEITALARRSTRLALVPAVPLAAACTVAPVLVLRVFAGGYQPAAPALVISALGSLLVVAVGPVNAVLLTCGQEEWAGRVNAVLLTVAVMVMLLVAPRWGATGVAVVLWGCLLGYSIVAAGRIRDRESIRAGYLTLPRLAAGRVTDDR